MPVGEDSFKNPIEACFRCRAIDLDAHIGNASTGLDELFIEGRQIKLLFRFRNRLILRHSRPDIVLDANPERPNMGLLPGHDLQQTNLGNLARLLALLFAKRSAFPAGQLPGRKGPCRDDEQVEGMQAPFGHEPAHHLFRRYVDWIGFHRQLLLARRGSQVSAF